MSKSKTITKPLSQHLEGAVNSKMVRRNLPLEKLRELINVANLLPDGLPTIEEIWAAKKKSDVNTHARSMLEILDRLPSEVREFVGEYPAREFELGESGPHYISVSSFGAGAMEVLSLRANVEEKYGYLVSGKLLLSAFADNWDGKNRLVFRDRIILNPEGLTRATVALPSWADWVPLVDISRIRRCLVCKQIFWANHGNKQTCSAPCSNTNRVRRYRKNYNEKYKQQRYVKAETTGKTGQPAKKGK